ncbi:hypothetical protein [Saccharicrinis sp. GN24d3]|uniref:hypothetical protein n=1 Tax=Saccharicrinis sp. GN24d3 TaxID=3458416 RepID=UPI0040366FB5
MKLHLILTALLILTLNAFSQITFEPGYFVNQKNDTVQCFIKNMDWKNNPDKFQYKIGENGAIKIATTNDTKEFHINNHSKYESHKVNIDRSTDNIEELGISNEPQYSEETLFLKLLVAGKVKLYAYEDRNLNRYFISTSTTKVEQLIYKRYLLQGKISYNKKFKQQLFTLLNDPQIDRKDIINLDYERKDLIKLINQYNGNGESTPKDRSNRKSKIWISLKGGISFSNITMRNKNFSSSYEHNNSLGYRFGAASELPLPFNNNKWAIIVEPTLRFMDSKLEVDQELNHIKYNSLEVPIGIRHYFYVGEKKSIFLNAMYIFDMPLNSNILINRFNNVNNINVNVNTVSNFAVGAGFLLGKCSAEARYGINRQLTGDYMTWDTDYNELSIIIGLKLF